MSDKYASAEVLETRKSTVNMDRMDFVMDLLIRNYSKPEEAVLRELVSNAFDAYTEAMDDDNAAVIVTLPTVAAPTLVVEDFGLGMTTEGFQTTFQNIGTTTKEGLPLIGQIGIGGKSALAITDSYIVETVRNGVKSVFRIVRSKEQGIVSELLLKEETNRPSGTRVEVVVPTNRIRKMRESVFPTLSGWSSERLAIENLEDSESVNVTGFRVPEEFEATEDPEVLIHKDAWKKNGAAQSALVPDKYIPYGLNLLVSSAGVLYPFNLNGGNVDSYIRSRLSGGAYAGIVINLPYRAVTFASGREVIEETNENVDRIAQALTRGVAILEKQFAEREKNLQSVAEAAELVCSYAAGVLGRDTVNFNGEAVGSRVPSVREILHLRANNKSEHYSRLSNRDLADGAFSVMGTAENAISGRSGMQTFAVMVPAEREVPETSWFRTKLRAYITEHHQEFPDVDERNGIRLPYFAMLKDSETGRAIADRWIALEDFEDAAKKAAANRKPRAKSGVTAATKREALLSKFMRFLHGETTHASSRSLRGVFAEAPENATVVIIDGTDEVGAISRAAAVFRGVLTDAERKDTVVIRLDTDNRRAASTAKTLGLAKFRTYKEWMETLADRIEKPAERIYTKNGEVMSHFMSTLKQFDEELHSQGMERISQTVMEFYNNAVEEARRIQDKNDLAGGSRGFHHHTGAFAQLNAIEWDRSGDIYGYSEDTKRAVAMFKKTVIETVFLAASR